MENTNPSNLQNLFKLSDQIFNQAAQAIAIQIKWNAQYIEALQHLAEDFPLEKDRLHILEAVFPKRMHLKDFELAGDFSLSTSSQQETGVKAHLIGVPIPLSYDSIYNESHSCETRLCIKVDQINSLI